MEFAKFSFTKTNPFSNQGPALCIIFPSFSVSSRADPGRKRVTGDGTGSFLNGFHTLWKRHQCPQQQLPRGNKPSLLLWLLGLTLPFVYIQLARNRCLPRVFSQTELSSQSSPPFPSSDHCALLQRMCLETLVHFLPKFGHSFVHLYFLLQLSTETGKPTSASDK